MQERSRQGMTCVCMCGCMQVAEALSKTKDMAVEAHARDELGIDLEDLDEKTNPWQVELMLSSLPFCCKTCRGIAAPRGHVQKHADYLTYDGAQADSPVVDYHVGILCEVD